MPARGHYAGQRKASSLWNVEIRRHQKPRAAFEEHVFDLVGVSFDDLRHAGIERCLFRIGSERLADFSPHGLNVGFCLGLRGQLCQSLQTLLMQLVLARHEKFLDHAREAVERRQRRRFSHARRLHRVGGKAPGQRHTGTTQRKCVEHPAAGDASAASGSDLTHARILHEMPRWQAHYPQLAAFRPSAGNPVAVAPRIRENTRIGSRLTQGADP